MLSARRERQAVEKVARQELLSRVGPSLQRHELRQLTRSQLRQRLRDLGAADTEGDGMLFGNLVDLVLLWNALGRLQDYENWSSQQEEALLALAESGLALDLLLRVLMVVGVPIEECQSLGQKEAAALVHEKLLQLRPEAPSELCIVEEGDLRGAAELLDDSDQAAVVIEVADVNELQDARLGHISCPVELVEEISKPPCTVPSPSAIGVPQDDKFEALDADLANFLDQMDVPLTSSPAAPIAADSLARDAKFDALDADLSDCIDRHTEEAPPLADGQWPQSIKDDNLGRLAVIHEEPEDGEASHEYR